MKNKITFENPKGYKKEYKAPDFGQVIIKIQNGVVVHVDRIESIKGEDK
ncbi:hypothetical protein [Vagococcus fluvialis]|nr:hypothetical protein [Vagococcus fluvialis]UDM74064.1 hypothetical protein K5K99_00040 [Vagococcus fluvialis]